MLHEGILHRCIKQLLEKKKNLPIQESAEDLECLCQIIKTVGRRLDTPKAKVSKCVTDSAVISSWGSEILTVGGGVGVKELI